MKPSTLRERLVTFLTFSVAALCVACDDEAPPTGLTLCTKRLGVPVIVDDVVQIESLTVCDPR